MKIEQAFREVLKGIPALVDRPVRVTVADDADQPPYVVFRNILGERLQTLQGDCGLGKTRMQVDVYAETAMQASTLKDDIRNALLGATAFSAIFLNEGAGQEPASKLHRYRQDFSIWMYDNN